MTVTALAGLRTRERIHETIQHERCNTMHNRQHAIAETT
jgi:hypothetical protein